MEDLKRTEPDESVFTAALWGITGLIVQTLFQPYLTLEQ